MGEKDCRLDGRWHRGGAGESLHPNPRLVADIAASLSIWQRTPSGPSAQPDPRLGQVLKPGGKTLYQPARALRSGDAPTQRQRAADASPGFSFAVSGRGSACLRVSARPPRRLERRPRRPILVDDPNGLATGRELRAHPPFMAFVPIHFGMPGNGGHLGTISVRRRARGSNKGDRRRPWPWRRRSPLPRRAADSRGDQRFPPSFASRR